MLCTILLVLILGWDIFEKEGESGKGYIEIGHWGTSVQLVLGFQENSM